MTMKPESVPASWPPREGLQEAHTEAGEIPAMPEAVLVGGEGMSFMLLGISLCVLWDKE